MTLPILIIGASHGIGAALARALASQGRALHLMARDGAALGSLAQEIGAAYSVLDVMEAEAIAPAIAHAGANGLGGLAYCVGSIPLKPLKAASAQDFLDTYRLNLLGAALAAKAATPLMPPYEAGGGSMLFFSTVAVHQGFSNHTIIASAKGAVEGLALSLAAELAPAVRVNVIAPSLTDTPLAAPLTQNAAMAKAIAGLHPIPRLGQAEDAAALGAFLLSDQAAWITGQVIGLDGGRARLRTKG